MTYFYQGGQTIPENVIDAIRFTGKVGFLSRELWHEFFGIGSFRWKNQQLQFVAERGLLRKHRNSIAQDFWVLDKRGIELLREMKGPCVTPVPANYLRHDSVVARSMLALQKEKLIRTFHVERELKTYGVRDFLLNEKDQDKKYPDAVCKMEALGGKRTVAIEYEKERKSSGRYKSILFQYAKITNLSMVLFIVESVGTRTAIEGAMKHLGQTALVDKLAVVNAEDWQRSPLHASISLKSGIVKLGEICTRMNA
jgi:hypothetical protein